MWEDTSCCFHYFELEDCPHLTGKTSQLLSGRRGINPQIFSLKSLAEMHTLVLYFLMYYKGGHRFQWCLGKHRFSCAWGGIWYLISPSYCCGQNRGITNCLLWSELRTLSNHSRVEGWWLCVCLLNTWVVALGRVLLEALQLNWRHHQLPLVQPCSKSCLWATLLDLSAHCCSSHLNLRWIFHCKLGDFPDDQMRGKLLKQCSEAGCLNSSELNQQVLVQRNVILWVGVE